MTQEVQYTVLAQQRRGLLHEYGRIVEGPMLLLAVVWLALLVVELVYGTSATGESASIAIWIIFLLDFAVRVVIAPQKGVFLRKQWLTAISLALPALRLLRIGRVVRILRATRAARSVRLVRIVSTLNRGLRALRATMGRRGAGFVLLGTMAVTLAGAAGMYAFEEEQEPGLHSYGAALWWTAMMMTTVGSDYFPRSPEGRVLCLMLATYAFAVWGYLTATLATYFVGRDAENEKGEAACAAAVADVREELQKLRQRIEELGNRS